MKNDLRETTLGELKAYLEKRVAGFVVIEDYYGAQEELDALKELQRMATGLSKENCRGNRRGEENGKSLQ